MSSPFLLRPATEEDLPVVIRIDDDACRLYTDAGVVLGLDDTHPFTIAERQRWLAAAKGGGLFFAVDDEGTPLGFAALGLVDGAPYLDQLSVSYQAMRRGVGRFLLHRALEWARDRDGPLWLTTYAHLLFNRPFYESEGFVVIREPAGGPELHRLLDEQRQWLPHPEERVAMRRDSP